jgi:putative DNA primase/helicase
MPRPKKDAAEAARKAEARARKAQKQHAPKPMASKPKAFNSEELLQGLRDEEQGDARLTVQALTGLYCCDKKAVAWCRFNGQHWSPDTKEQGFQEANRLLSENYRKEAGRQFALSMNMEIPEEERKQAGRYANDLSKRVKAVNRAGRMRNIMDLAAKGDNSLAITGDEWDRDIYALQCKNALIDLKTGRDRPGRPEDYISKAAPAEWKGLHCEAPTWETAYAEIFESRHTAHYFHKVLGASLLGKPLSEFFILWGDGANGKTTLLETAKEALGELAGPVNKDLLMGYRPKGNGADPELLDLRGKRLIWTSETRKGSKLNIEQVKQFTGSDTLKARYNYSNDLIEFRPQFQAFLLSNHRPVIESTDYGTWRRIRLIPFTFRFVDDPQADNEKPKIPDLEQRLQGELSGVLAWMVRGCLAFQGEGLEPPPDVLEATRDYQGDEDYVLQFIQARCLTEGKVQAGPLYEAFSEWFKEEYGTTAKVPGKRTFSDNLRGKYTRDTSGRHTYYLGISLKSDG